MKKEHQLDSPQNSPFRPFLKKFFDPAVILLGKLGVDPNTVTKTGTGLTILGAFLMTQEEKLNRDLSLAAFSLIAVGLICDGLDGALARHLDKATVDGALYDLVNDRIQESALAVSRIITAAQRRDLLGIITATIAGLTNPFPSYFRALIESEGGIASETGEKFISLFGTRGGRSGLSAIATAFPDGLRLDSGVSLQPLCDAVLALSNLITTAERVRKLLGISKEEGETLRREREGEILSRERSTDDFSKREEIVNLVNLGRKKGELLTRYMIINSFIMIAMGTVGVLSILLNSD